MENSIFPIFSLNRNEIKWEDYLFKLTPINKKAGLLFKREDMFAPLGINGINGAKLRQAIYLVSEFKRKNYEPKILISGTSVKSPQLAMGSAIATHFGFDSLHVIGATNPESAIKKPMVQMATWFGAKFDIIKVAYNPALKKRIKELLKFHQRPFYLEYGITIDHLTNTPEDLYNFHYVGANQVRNIPDEVERIVIPAGSCNSCTSILLGLFLFPPKNLKEIYLIGIGPSKYQFMMDRLKIMSVYAKINLADNLAKFKLNYYDLFREGYTDYQAEVPFSFGEIEFHPTYEGKVMKYVSEKLPYLMDDKTLFWIIGSKPRVENMEHLISELGSYPNKIRLFDGKGVKG